MKTRIYIAALLAGMLALAGCGGGGSTTQQESCPDGQTGTPPNCMAAENMPPPTGLVAADVAKAIKAYADSTSGQKLANAPALLASGSSTAEVKDGVTTITLRKRDGSKAQNPTNINFPITGWYGSRFEFENRDGKQSGAVITSIEAPASTGMTWDLYFNDDTDEANDGIGIRKADRPTGVGNGGEFATKGTLTFNAAVTTNGIAAYFKDVVDKEDTTITIEAGKERKAKFAGIDGTYKCGGGSCTIAIEGKDVKLTGGALTFEPTLADGQDLTDLFVAGTPTPDADYLLFNYWMSGSDQEIYTNARTRGRGYISGDGENTLNAIVNNTTATYRGAAGGYYTHGTNAGEFAAKAELKAVFGNGGTGDKAAAGADRQGISGTISDFKAITGGATLSAWKLTLKKAVVPAVGGGGIMTAATTSPDASNGQWSARFFDLTDVQNAAASDTVHDYPDAVAGQFTGNFGAGSHAAGAFAAETDEFKHKQ